MKRILLAAVGGLVMLSMTAGADNITINDTIGASGNGVGGENNEVEPGCTLGQGWDMEAFLYNPATRALQMQGGFNMMHGYGGYFSGDIFIDVNGDAKWGANTPVLGLGGSYATVANSLYNWDYAIVFGRTTADQGGSALDGTYRVINLAAGSPTDVEVYFSQNGNSNPLRYNRGGTQVGQTVTGLTQTSFDDSDGTHYILGNIDLSFLAGTGTGPNGFTFHFTEGCGNDLLMGGTPAFNVPDGGLTLALLGGSLSALGFVSRRVRKNP